jgi:hypothetical protein
MSVGVLHFVHDLKGLLKNPEKECASLLARFLARIK